MRHTMNATRFIITAALGAAVAGTAGCGHDDDDAPPLSATFAFDTAAPVAYTQIDRMGMPAVGTAVITDKDGYNRASPAADAAGTFLPDISANVDAIHAKLDDDITAAGLVPATSAETLAQAGPLIVPDTIVLNTAVAAGFPNGRKLPDQVIDITLAVVLLDLSTTGYTARTLANLPLNPAANDKAFLTTFPYLAAPF